MEIRLLLVRSDWSKGKNVENVDSELLSLLEGVPLSASFRANLKASAAQILFSDQFVTIYRPGKLESLLAWLTEHELLRVGERATPIADAPASATRSPSDASGQDPDDPTKQHYRMFVNEKTVPLPLPYGDGLPESPDTPPFVTRSRGCDWQFTSRFRQEAGPNESTMRIEVRRALVVRDELGISPGGMTEKRRPLPPERLAFAFPADRVAVIHYLHGLASSYPPPSRAQMGWDWDPILVIAATRGKERVTISPALAKPESFVKAAPVLTLREGTRKHRPWRAEPSVSSGPSDTASKPRFWNVFPLRRTKAGDAAKLLGQLIEDGTFSADEKNNSLVAVVTKDECAIVEALVKHLDSPAAGSPAAAAASGAGSKPRFSNVFPLRRTKAGDTAKLLSQLIEDGTFSADEKNNSLVAVVTKDECAIVEALVKHLDSPAAGVDASVKGKPSRPAMPLALGIVAGAQTTDLAGFVRATREQYTALEREAKALAQLAREQVDAKTADQLRQRLRATVAEAFGLRQQLHEAELRLLRQRIQKIEATLGRRQALRDVIIDRRIEALLSRESESSSK